MRKSKEKEDCVTICCGTLSTGSDVPNQSDKDSRDTVNESQTEESMGAPAIVHKNIH